MISGQVADVSEVEEYHAYLRSQKRKSESSGSSDSVPLLSAGYMKRLKVFESKLKQGQMVSDITQNYTFSGGSRNVLGCLLRHSRWWHHGLGRELCPREALQVPMVTTC